MSNFFINGNGTGGTSVITINNISPNGSGNFTLTAGNGIALTPGTNSITISSTESANYTDVATSGTLTTNNGYFVTAASTQTLPASPAQGDTIQIIVDTTGTVVIKGNTGQTIRIGPTVSASAGTATNSARGDGLVLIYRAATTSWIQQNSPQGIWNLV